MGLQALLLQVKYRLLLLTVCGKMTTNVSVSKHLLKANAAIGSITTGVSISMDVVRYIFLSTLANAQAEERLLALEDWISTLSNPDPALIEGFNIAKADFDNYVNIEWYGILKKCFLNVQVGEMVTKAAFEFALKSILNASSSGAAMVLLPYCISWELGKAVREQSKNGQDCTIAATLWKEMSSNGLSSSINKVNPSNNDIRTISNHLNLTNISSYLGWYFYDRYLDISNNTASAIFGNGADIMNWSGYGWDNYSEFIDYLESSQDFAYNYYYLTKPPIYLSQHAESFDVNATDKEYLFLLSKLRDYVPILTNPDAELKASFTLSKNNGFAPLTVDFTSNSVGSLTSWKWNFGDGTIFNGANPGSHTFSKPGIYSVTLEVSNGVKTVKSDPAMITVNNIPITADFSVINKTGLIPFVVSFSNLSTGSNMSYLWNFGDGTSSTSVNPTHTYNQAGNFTVSLFTSGDGGSDSETKSNFIIVTGNSGTIEVSTNLPESGFLIEGPQTLIGSGTNKVFQNVLPGTYTIKFIPLAEYSTPPDETKTLLPNNTYKFIGTYSPKAIIFNPNLAYGAITDIDGNNYKTIQIGSQTWMAENLKVTKYADGAPLIYISGDANWDALSATDKAYCWYNDDLINKSTFGALYTWSAAMKGLTSSNENPSGIQGVCPTGWHLPSHTEWIQLTDFLGGESLAGSKLKETSSTHWTNPNNEATNETGFTALPGGYRIPVGTFNHKGNYAYWWSSTEESNLWAFVRTIYYDANNLFLLKNEKESGLSVRCIKDNPAPTPPIVGQITQPTCAVVTGSVVLSGLPTSGIWTITRYPEGITYTGTSSTIRILMLSSGTYTFTVTNSTGAISISSEIVTINAQPVAPAGPMITSIQPTCTIATGTIAVTAPTGTDMAYSINGSTYTNTTGIFTSVTPGTYTVTAKSSTGCISTGTVVTIIAQPIAPAAPATTLTQPSCTIATGTITVTAPTGNGMTYSINGSTYTNTTGSFTLVTPGTYTVTAKSSAGCISTGTIVTINAQPVAPAAPTIIVTQPTCTVATGTITVTSPSGVGMTYSVNGITFTNSTGVFTSIAPESLALLLQKVQPDVFLQ